MGLEGLINKSDCFSFSFFLLYCLRCTLDITHLWGEGYHGVSLDAISLRNVQKSNFLSISEYLQPTWNPTPQLSRARLLFLLLLLILLHRYWELDPELSADRAYLAENCPTRYLQPRGFSPLYLIHTFDQSACIYSTTQCIWFLARYVAEQLSLAIHRAVADCRMN